MQFNKIRSNLYLSTILFVMACFIINIGTDGLAFEPESTVSEASYIIYKDANITYALNGRTDVIDFSGLDSGIVIQSAINALDISGGKVFIKAGNYILTSSTSILVINKSNVIFEGEGEGTLFILSNNVNNDVIRIATVSNVTIKNIKIDGNKNSQTAGNGIVLSGEGKNIVIENVRIENIKNDGIRVANKTSSGFTYILIHNVKIYNVDGNGIAPQDWWTVSNCFIDTTGNHGIIMPGYIPTQVGSSYNVIDSNRVSNTGEMGIALDNGASYNTLTNNYIQNTTWHGIAMEDTCYNNLISGNTVQDAGQVGISSFGTQYAKACLNNRITKIWLKSADMQE